MCDTMTPVSAHAHANAFDVTARLGMLAQDAEAGASVPRRAWENEVHPLNRDMGRGVRFNGGQHSVWIQLWLDDGRFLIPVGDLYQVRVVVGMGEQVTIVWPAEINQWMAALEIGVVTAPQLKQHEACGELVPVPDVRPRRPYLSLHPLWDGGYYWDPVCQVLFKRVVHDAALALWPQSLPADMSRLHARWTVIAGTT